MCVRRSDVSSGACLVFRANLLIFVFGVPTGSVPSDTDTDRKIHSYEKIIVLFLVTCTLCRCCVTFARPVEIETAFRILPQRVSHIRITKFDHFTYVMRFAYDAQGRIVSVVESDFSLSG